MRDSGIQMVDDADELTGSANPNRKEDGGGGGGEWASGIDAAIGTLSLDGGGGGGAAAERHPEKRLKAVSVVAGERRATGEETCCAFCRALGGWASFFRSIFTPMGSLSHIRTEARLRTTRVGRSPFLVCNPGGSIVCYWRTLSRGEMWDEEGGMGALCLKERYA